MQSHPSRNISPGPYRHENESHGNQLINRSTRDQVFYNPPFDGNEHVQHAELAPNFPHDHYFHGNPEYPPQMNHDGNVGDSSSDVHQVTQYNYMNDPIQATQPHVLPQVGQFHVPATRMLHDATGQACPPGGRPQVSTTIWEDEGTLCFQVEAKQVTVARREDNNMVNGTKLLNVAQMSRGKRDGILKNETTRAVIKVGSMHLKGVWIPFERALELANKYHVTDMLYPLFVKDIKKFLYHPANYARTQAVLAAANHRQAQHGSTSVDGMPEDRPLLERTASMPTPLDRSLSMLTPPSSASTTNGDYWTNGQHGNVPLSDTHARAHSLPGTPATTPPAPGYFMQGVPPTHSYVPFTEPRVSTSGNRYGQQLDMQRSYNHSRTASVMSYQDEDGSNASSSHNLAPEGYSTMQSQLNRAQAPGHGIMYSQDQARYRNAPYHVMNDQKLAYAQDGQMNQLGSTHLAPATPGHTRSHSRSHSRESGKVFHTPNLTTQMSRRSLRTPNGSPARTHVRQSSRDLANQPNQASLWVQQQQQMLYSTPQQTLRGHSRQMSGQLPHIYEETPSCRMAYQLHGQGRLTEPYPRLVETSQTYTTPLVSPARGQFGMEPVASPLNGKKKRDRVVSDRDPYFRGEEPYEDRQESLTPPPITRQEEIEESPKRRRSERTGMHSRSGSLF